MNVTTASGLRGKRGVVVGAANEARIAAGCARSIVGAGASGAISARAASEIADSDDLMAAEAAAASEHQRVGVDDVGALAAFLASDATRQITDAIISVDGVFMRSPNGLAQHQSGDAAGGSTRTSAHHVIA